MNIEFIWTNQPDPNDQSVVEAELKAIFDDEAIQACHSGTVAISLEIGGPLDTTLAGSAQCKCGKVIATFIGDNTGASLKFNQA